MYYGVSPGGNCNCLGKPKPPEIRNDPLEYPMQFRDGQKEYDYNPFTYPCKWCIKRMNRKHQIMNPSSIIKVLPAEVDDFFKPVCINYDILGIIANYTYYNGPSYYCMYYVCIKSLSCVCKKWFNYFKQERCNIANEWKKCLVTDDVLRQKHLSRKQLYADTYSWIWSQANGLRISNRIKVRCVKRSIARYDKVIWVEALEWVMKGSYFSELRATICADHQQLEYRCNVRFPYCDTYIWCDTRYVCDDPYTCAIKRLAVDESTSDAQTDEDNRDTQTEVERIVLLDEDEDNQTAVSAGEQTDQFDSDDYDGDFIIASNVTQVYEDGDIFDAENPGRLPSPEELRLLRIQRYAKMEEDEIFRQYCADNENAEDENAEDENAEDENAEDENALDEND